MNSTGEAERGDIRRMYSATLDDIWIDGTWKRTAGERLPVADETLCNVLAKDGVRDIEWMDVGASDGVTTIDTVRAIRKALGCNVRTWLTDRYTRIDRFRSGNLVEYRESQGGPVLVRWRNIGLRLPRSPRRFDYFSTFLARLYLSFRPSLKPDGGISLINPAMADDGDVEVLELDVHENHKTLAGRFDLVRASNILNRVYFPEREIRVAISHLSGYLKENGLLLVSRNKIGRGGETEHGSLWRREGGRFIEIASFGEGSEIRDLVMGGPSEEGPHAGRGLSREGADG